MTLLLSLALLIHPAPPVAHITIRPVPDQWEATHPYRAPKWAALAKFTTREEVVTSDAVLRTPGVSVTAPPLDWTVEQWRPLVAAYFPPDQVEKALAVMACESGGNPNAHNPSGATGLMQVLASWADNFGLSPDDLYDPATNLMVARALYDDGLSRTGWGWVHWVCA